MELFYTRMVRKSLFIVNSAMNKIKAWNLRLTILEPRTQMQSQGDNKFDCEVRSEIEFFQVIIESQN